jgi:hypothetical protein
MEPEVMPPSGPGPDFDGIRIKVAHVRSLGAVGAVLALLTMLAAVGFALLMLFGKALLAAALVTFLWPAVFSPEFTVVVFGTPSVPFWKIFLLLASASIVAKMLWPSSWGRR